MKRYYDRRNTLRYLFLVVLLGPCRLLLRGQEADTLYDSLSAPDSLHIGALDAQRKLNFFEINYEAGTPIRSTASMKSLTQQAYTSGISFTVGHQYMPEEYGPVTGRRYYPTLGLTVVYSNFSRVKMVPGVKEKNAVISDYGHFVAISPSFTHYHNIDGTWRLKTIVENGLGYAFHPYNYDKNPYSSIGGHFQIYFSYGIFTGRQLGKTEFSVGPQFTHYSNSGTYRPNRGINNVALSMRIKQADRPYIPRSNPALAEQEFLPYVYFTCNFNGGFHTYKEEEMLFHLKHPGEVYRQSPTVYGDLNVSTDFMYRPKSYMAVGAGLDFFYRGGYDLLHEYYTAINSEQALRHVQRLYLGLGLKHETYIGNFAIEINVGAYLNDKHLVNIDNYTRLYERIGLRYYIGEGRVRPYVGYFIKGNVFTAEQFEFCFGLSFNRLKTLPEPWWRDRAIGGLRGRRPR